MHLTRHIRLSPRMAPAVVLHFSLMHDSSLPSSRHASPHPIFPLPSSLPPYFRNARFLPWRIAPPTDTPPIPTRITLSAASRISSAHAIRSSWTHRPLCGTASACIPARGSPADVSMLMAPDGGIRMDFFSEGLSETSPQRRPGRGSMGGVFHEEERREFINSSSSTL